MFYMLWKVILVNKEEKMNKWLLGFLFIGHQVKLCFPILNENSNPTLNTQYIKSKIEYITFGYIHVFVVV